MYVCIYFNLRTVKAEATIALEMSEKCSAADSADVHHSWGIACSTFQGELDSKLCVKNIHHRTI